MKFEEKKRWVFFGLPFTFTKYIVSDSYVTIESGLFKHTVNDCYMYKIVDVELSQSLVERIFGLGSVKCFGGDVTNPTLVLQHIKKSKEIKNFILEASENERIKRKTLNMQNLDMHPEPGMGCPPPVDHEFFQG